MLADLMSWLDQYPYLWPLFIIPARITDQSLGTVRTIAVVKGRRLLATVLGFLEVLVWVAAVSGVLAEITVLKVVSYAAGFALGNLVGIGIERRLALGHQMVTLVSSHRAQSVAFALRLANFVVTEVPAKGGRGDVAMCFAVVPRRRSRDVIARAREVDPGVHAVVQDLNATDLVLPRSATASTGWRALFQRK